MKTLDDARALCERENDPFYLDAFLIEAWLGGVVLDAASEYAEKKNARERQMQSGHAWSRFLELFGHAKDEEFHFVLQSLLRFAQYDDVQSVLLCQAILPLSMEGGTASELLAKEPSALAKDCARGARLMRESVKRWCDWLDAAAHWQTHSQYHVLPESYDPDPQKRELAALGLMQRAFSALDAFGKSWWEWHHREAAERLKDSSKWTALGKIMSAPLRDDRSPAPVDEIVICLWPLVKRHNWTYRDLMGVIRQVLPPPHRYPLEREQDLAAYCPNVLGLRKPPGPTGRSSPDGRPPAWEVALRLCGREPGRESS